MADDVWAPWASADPAALAAVFELTTFEEQVRALLELEPKASAKQIAALPWDEARPVREYKIVTDAWRLEKGAKRALAKDAEPSIESQLQDQFEAAVSTQNLKGAKEAMDLLVKMRTAKGVKREREAQDDFTRLDPWETLMLGALVHKLRGEPLTTQDTELLAYVALLDKEPDASAEQSSG